MSRRKTTSRPVKIENLDMLQNLPEELKKYKYFCGCDTHKVPINLMTGEKANVDYKKDFCGFKKAANELLKHKARLGLGVFDKLGVIDIDDCVQEDGTLTPMAQFIVATIGSYAEKSPSGKGLHIYFWYEGEYDKDIYRINNQKLKLEIYIGGVTNKFVSVTGNVFMDKPIRTITTELQPIMDAFMRRGIKSVHHDNEGRMTFLEDDKVIERAKKSAQSKKFTLLWEGNIEGYSTHSEADMALIFILAFWCNGDMDQIDRLFRESGLMRDKWDRAQSGSTYGWLSIEKAVSSMEVFYTPFRVYSADEDFGLKATLEELCPETNERFPMEDIGDGRLFADCFKSIARFVPERKMWYCYENGRWVPDVAGLRTAELCKALADSLLMYSLSVNSESTREAYIKHCSRWRKHGVRVTIVSEAQSVYPIPMNSFDQDPYIFNCNNGTLHLDTMEFTQHNADDRLSKISPVDYDPSARCERFERFINEISNGDKEKALFLQKAMGYGLSGDTRHECLFVLYGATTRNGKGTLCESVLKVLGGYGCTSRPETISLKKNSNSTNPTEDIARLVGVRFANISEPGRGLVLNAAQVKSMTGNDTINARFLHENSFDFTPQFKLYINANYLPVINDMTLFTSGRVIIIPFDRHFDESEQDKTLKREFAKPKNQSAILNWLIEGFRLLQSQGFDQPASVLKATDAYRHESDKIMLFKEEVMIESPQKEIRTSEVYSRYKSWCYDNGYYVENSRNFNQALRTFAKIEKRRPRSGGGATTLVIGYELYSDFLQ